MAGENKTTIDHEIIRKWAEERQGHPAEAKDAGGGNEAGILRIDFGEAEPDLKLEPISWEEFFEKFEERGLAFLYQERTTDGKISRFFELIKRPEYLEDLGAVEPPDAEDGNKAEKEDLDVLEKEDLDVDEDDILEELSGNEDLDTENEGEEDKET